jgi:hypothetical protein
LKVATLSFLLIVVALSAYYLPARVTAKLRPVIALWYGRMPKIAIVTQILRLISTSTAIALVFFRFGAGRRAEC